MNMLKRVQASTFFGKLTSLYERYERFLLPGTMIVGVVVDYITFRTINITTTFLLLGVYALVAGGAIGFINIYDVKRRQHRYGILRYVRLAMPLLLQFTFGALLSASLIFYWFSGSVSVSWPIMGILAFLMMGNEVFRHYYEKPIVQFGLYYFVLFSLGTLVFPFLLHSLSPLLFVGSGVLAFGVVALYAALLSKITPRIAQLRVPILLVSGVLCSCMNALYFARVIPPIPLSIREAAVYHLVERVSDGYIVRSEETTWLEDVWPSQTVHIRPDTPVYVFSSVFAPSGLSTTIVHNWQHFDEERKEWVSVSKPRYQTVGGRGDGYRGYTFLSKIASGKWRVDIETERGQVLGRLRFSVEFVGEQPVLVGEKK